MSASNKTMNLELPQFIATDKPTWLGDWNDTMGKIDNFAGDTDIRHAAITASFSAMEVRLSNDEDRITTLENMQGGTDTDISQLQLRTTVLESNYDQIHHEVALLSDDVSKTETDLTAAKAEIVNVQDDVSVLDSLVETQGEDIAKHAAKLEKIMVGNTFNVYVDGANGNDDNTGLTESSPIKTLDKAGTMIRERTGMDNVIILGKGTLVMNTYLHSGSSSLKIKPWNTGEVITIEVGADAFDISANSEIVIENALFDTSLRKLTLVAPIVHIESTRGLIAPATSNTGLDYYTPGGSFSMTVSTTNSNVAEMVHLYGCSFTTNNLNNVLTIMKTSRNATLPGSPDLYTQFDDAAKNGNYFVRTGSGSTSPVEDSWTEVFSFAGSSQANSTQPTFSGSFAGNIKEIFAVFETTSNNTIVKKIDITGYSETNVEIQAVHCKNHSGQNFTLTERQVIVNVTQKIVTIGVCATATFANNAAATQTDPTELIVRKVFVR